MSSSNVFRLKVVKPKFSSSSFKVKNINIEVLSSYLSLYYVYMCNSHCNLSSVKGFKTSCQMVNNQTYFSNEIELEKSKLRKVELALVS